MRCLLIRADSAARIGTGHIMRCIALAQAWQGAGGKVAFLSYCESEILRQRIREQGFDFIPIERPHPDPGDMEKTLHLLAQYKLNISSVWVALDGYHFTPGYQKTVRDKGYKLLIIDDYNHLSDYHADILLNQNINARELDYSCDEDTIKLLGCKYTLLRREFLNCKYRKLETPDKVRNILVTLGGADSDNVTLKVIKALNMIGDSDLDVKIVIGPANQHIKSLKKELAFSLFSYELLSSVKDMTRLMVWADATVSAGGSTCWELAFMGVPTVILILAENQTGISAGLAEKKVATDIGWHNNITPEGLTHALNEFLEDYPKRKAFFENGKKLVDGKGVQRVVSKMMGHQKFTLRKANEEDCEMVWKWANASDARDVSFHTDPITWDTHKKWFFERLKDHQCVFYIGMNDDGYPIGQIRFNVDGNEAVISININKNFRGEGLGSRVIKKGCDALFVQESGIEAVSAWIKESNAISLRAFAKAGFKLVERRIHKGCPSHLMRYERLN